MTDFSCELKNRSVHLTEDNVRYYLFACMLRQDPDLNNYMLELPYNNIRESEEYYLPIQIDPAFLSGSSRQELDMCYDNGIECLCIEVKFHRKSDATISATTKTENAGKVFNDLRRLSIISKREECSTSVRKLFVYVTDADMHTYFTKGNDAYTAELRSFYEANIGKACSVDFADVEPPSTFIDNAEKDCPASVGNPLFFGFIKLYNSDFFCFSPSLGKNRACHVHLYEVI